MDDYSICTTVCSEKMVVAIAVGRRNNLFMTMLSLSSVTDLFVNNYDTFFCLICIESTASVNHKL